MAAGQLDEEGISDHHSVCTVTDHKSMQPPLLVTMQAGFFFYYLSLKWLVTGGVRDKERGPKAGRRQIIKPC